MSSALALLRHDLWFATRSLVRNKSFAIAATTTLAARRRDQCRRVQPDQRAVAALPSHPRRRPCRGVLLSPTAASRLPDGTGAVSRQVLVRSVSQAQWWHAHHGGDRRQEGATANEDLKPWPMLPNGRALRATAVSSNYFEVLGVQIRGRSFARSDDQPGAPLVAILADSTSARVYCGADEGALGKGVQLSGRSVVAIVGIAPANFRGPRRGDATEIWLLLRGAGHFVPGVPPHVLNRSPGTVPPPSPLRPPPSGRATATGAGRSTGDILGHSVYLRLKSLADTAYPVKAQALESRDQSLLALLAVTAFLVVVIGCLNLAGLLVARAEGQRRETAVRLALGIPRARLVGSVVFEVLLLSFVGSCGAIAVAQLIVYTLLGFSLPTGVPIQTIDLALDWRTVVFSVVATLSVTVLCTVAPAWRAAHVNPAVLRQSSSGVPRSGVRGRAALLAVHSALATLLLIGTGLLTRSVLNGYTTDLGFDGSRTAFLLDRAEPCRIRHRGLPRSGLCPKTPGPPAIRGARSRASPGVRAIAVGASLGLRNSDSVLVPREVTTDGQVRQLPIAVLTVGAHYFSAIGLPLLAGRDFDERDTSKGTTAVAVINERLARALWPGDRQFVGKLCSMAMVARGGQAARTLGQSLKPSASPPAGGDQQRTPGVGASQTQQILIVGVARDSSSAVHGPTNRPMVVYRPGIIDPDPAADMASPVVTFAIGTTTPVARLLPEIAETVADSFPGTRHLPSLDRRPASG